MSSIESIFGTLPPYLVGIINVTPDSFSDGGECFEAEKAIARGLEFKNDGASIIDIGGESTAPGAKPISAEEEWRRLEPAVKGLATNVFLSIDSFKANTADRCLSLGAKMINDVSGLRADKEMPAVIAAHNAWVVIMYSKENPDHPHVTDSPKEYTNLFREIADFLKRQIDVALNAGISFEKIIIDPGMGRFISNNPAYSWQLLKGLNKLKDEGITSPVMLGVSRKGFLGGPLKERDPISQLAAVIAYNHGATFIRTHNIKMARDFFDVWQRC